MKFLIAIVVTLLMINTAGKARAQPFAYVPNAASNYVSVINTATNTVATNIGVGTGPEGVAVNLAGTRVYVTNSTANTISAIDTATNLVMATIPVGANPVGVAVNSAGTRAYVTISGGSVAVIDAATNVVVNTVAVGINPESIAINAAGTRAYVTDITGNSVVVLDLAIDSVVTTVPVGNAPRGVAVNPSGTRVYVVNSGDGSVSVIDTAGNSVTTTISVGASPLGAAVNPAGTLVYVSNSGANNVSVIDTGTNGVTATIAVGASPWGVAFTPTGAFAYVANYNSNNVYVIDTAGNNVTAIVPVGSQPYSPGLFIGGPTAVLPGAPAIGTAVAGNGNAVVSFTPPLSNGGFPITSHTVTSTPGGLTGSGFSSPITVSGLTNGTSYTFTVTATNAIGAGPPSATSNAVTPLLPTLTLGAPSLTFPPQVISTTSAPLALTISNLSASAVVISAVVTSAGFSNDWSLSPPIAPPVQSVPLRAVVRNDGDEGTTNPARSIPESGSKKASGLVISLARTTGVPRSATALASNPTCYGGLGPGSICDIGVTFTPTVLGPVTGTLTITSNAGGSPQVVALFGSGVALTTYAPAVGLNFGSAVVGVTTPAQTVTFTNTSASTVNLNSISFNGGGAGFAVLVNSQCLSTPTLAPAASCTFDITATPNAAGALSDSVYVATTPSIAATPVNVPLQVIGIAAGPVFSPSATAFTFASQVLATTSVAQTLTITNTGTALLNSFGPAITGPFSITLNTCTGVAPAGSCTISFTFTPAVIGAASGTLSIPTNAAGSPHLIILSGTGVAAAAPAVTLSPPGPLNFGTVTVNTSSTAQGVTLTNSGSAALNIIGITSSGDFGFTTNCPFSTAPLAAAASCSISITFSPLTIAALVGNITITSTAPGSPHVINLLGTGSAVPVAGIGLSPTSLDFGSQGIGAASALQTVRVTNTGFANLILLGTSVSPPFTRVTIGPAQGDCGSSLAPSLSCQIAITFTPTVLGAASGVLAITDNAAGSPHQVSLTGIGTTASVPQISVPTALDFGDQVINTGGSKPLVIANPGSATLTITGLTLAGANAGQFATSGNCAAISAGASCTLTVNFLPATAGAKTAQLTIASNAAPNPNAAAAATVVNLAGNGILAPKPVAKLSVTGLGFGNVIFGGATPSQLITLTNIGGVAMSIAGILTTGDYVQANNCGATLNTNASCIINVAFTPLRLGSRSGELQVFTNADGSPHRVQLGGSGCRWFSQPLSRFLLTACG